MSTPEPALSVILGSIDDGRSLGYTLGALRAQSVADQIEVVVVAPSEAALGFTPDTAQGLHSLRVVETGAVRSWSFAAASGARAARAPVVAFGEDHSFPEPDWAEALLRAHAEDWAVVGPGIRSGNPGSLIADADFLIGYGPWAMPVERGSAEFLPGHNSSYKRSALLAQGEELEGLLDAEAVLHWKLRSGGAKLLLEPAAVTRHVNFSRLSTWIRVQFINGWLFGGSRARGWPFHKRLVFLFGSPLIPLVRLSRQVRAGITGKGFNPVRVLPVLFFGFCVDAVGQAWGYAFGPGAAHEMMAPFEFHREDHVSNADRKRYAAGIPRHL